MVNSASTLASRASYLFWTRPFHSPILRVILTLQTLFFSYQSFDTDAYSDKRSEKVNKSSVKCRKTLDQYQN